NVTWSCDGPRQLAQLPTIGPGPILDVNSVVVCSRGNEVAEYGSSTGAAVNLVTKTSSGGTDPADVAVTRDSEYAFTANLASKSLSVLRRDRLTHSLTLRGEYTVPHEPTHVDVNRNRIVAVAGTNPNYFGTFRFDRSTGTLSPINGVMLAQRPTAMAFADEVGTSSQLLYLGLRSNQAGVEDQIATYRIEPTGNFSLVGNTAAGLFLTDFIPSYDRLYAVTVNASQRDELRVYRRPGTQLVWDASVDTPESPSFKQVAVAPSRGRVTPVFVSAFQGGWLRSYEYTRDDDPSCASSTGFFCAGNRFRISAEWRVENQSLSGVGTHGSITPDTGYFWFFSPNNVELVVKALDGRGFNNSYWFFYGALSDVEYAIELYDIYGRTRRYENEPGRLASVGDVSAIPGAVIPFRASEATPPPAPAIRAGPIELSPLSRAVPFFIRVDWRVPSQGTSGRAQGVVLTSDTAYFWFFSANNVELVVKVVDGRPFNGYWWVFYGALSDVEYTITITDQATGQQKVYFNPSGTMASVADTAAFTP
ncbi:MAG TPA: beta-propeller fold lactonase family protein, partial [Thermoanaerobaculia bacterium]|nr:beta-propeller fold lactonase family protein [Thermoanaerobaculia bacterium]